MGENYTYTETEAPNLKDLSHTRILCLMGGVAVLGAVLGAVFKTWIFGIGILLGGVLAFVNYFWLKESLRRIFKVAEYGEKPKLFAAGYILRYLVLALVLALIYILDIVPIVAVVAGLLSFAISVVIEGILRIFLSFNKKEI